MALWVTKDKQASLEALAPQACQVRRVKRGRSCPYLGPLGQTAFRVLQDSQDPKVTEAFLELRAGQASLERRVLWASQGSGFRGPQVPKVSTACLEMWGLRGPRVAQDLMACLAAQVHRARRVSLELVYRDSKDCQVSPASLAHLGRRGTSGAQACPESMELSDPLGFRASEVTQGLLDCKAL